jgi:hypothetical protein
VTASAAVTYSDGPINHCLRFVLKGPLGQRVNDFCVNLRSGLPFAWQPNLLMDLQDHSQEIARTGLGSMRSADSTL